MIEAKPNGCQESNYLVPTLPCNQPAERMIGWPGRGEGPYRMCAMCANHSVRNRGAEDMGPYVADDGSGNTPESIANGYLRVKIPLTTEMLAAIDAAERSLFLTTLFYLSFADPQKPKGEQWLGAAIVAAPDFVAAVNIAHIEGINPGGEVVGQDVDAELEVPQHFIGRLLNKQDVADLDAALLAQRTKQ